MSKIKSLGIGSSVLTGELIDKLKAADEAGQIRPLQKKIQENTTKQRDVTAITTILGSLKIHALALGQETTYLKRKADINGKSIGIEVASSVNTHSFNIDVIQLAQNDVYQTNKFDAPKDIIAKKNAFTKGSFDISVGEQKFTIDVDTTMTYEELAAQINNKSKGALNAKILNVGGGKYELILQSKESGIQNAIKFEPSQENTANSLKILQSLGWQNGQKTNKFDDANSKNLFKKDGKFNIEVAGNKIEINAKKDMSLNDLAKEINDKSNGKIKAEIKSQDGKFELILTSLEGEIKIEPSKDSANADIEANSKEILQTLGFKTHTNGQIQQAKDAEFLYNGVKMTRSSNKFDDITVGVNITLKEIGKTSVDVTNDTKSITNEIEEFVKAYNNLINNLNVATDYNEKTNIAGTLQGINEISSIKSTLNKSLLKTEFLNKFVEEVSVSKDKKASKNSVLMPTSIADFGLSLNKNGLLEFKKSVFEKQINKDFDGVKRFFLGSTENSPITYTSNQISGGEIAIGSGALKINEKEIIFKTDPSNTAEQNAIELMNAINKADIKGLEVSISKDKKSIILNKKDGGVVEISGRDSDLSKLGLTKTTIRSQSNVNKGVFARLSENLEEMLGKVGKKGSIETLSEHLKEENKHLVKQKDSAQAWINERYLMMENQFAAYDAIIGKLNRQFAALESMINAELNKK